MTERVTAPAGDADSKPFWESCARHAMEVQRCEGCATFRFPPRPVCPHCMSDRAAWTRVAGTGTVHVQLGVHPRGRDAARVPYSLTMIQLDEGVRMWSNVVGAAPDDVHIGDRVRVVYDDVDGGTLPHFAPEGPDGRA